MGEVLPPPVAVQAQEEDEEEDELFEDPPTHCMGHRFHWAEGVLFIFLVAGSAFAVLAFLGIYEISSFVGSLLYAISSLISCMAVWGLATTKRLAASANLIKADLKRFKAEGNRAQGLQAEKRAQNAEFKDKLGELEKAQLLLSGSANGLDDVKKQEEEMMAEREELLVKRQELQTRMTEDMAAIWKAAIAQAKEDLFARAELYYVEVGNGTGITVGSETWDTLAELLAKNGVQIDAKAAGDDGYLDDGEFYDWLADKFDEHFVVLEKALRDSIRMELEIKDIIAAAKEAAKK